MMKSSAKRFSVLACGLTLVLGFGSSATAQTAGQGPCAPSQSSPAIVYDANQGVCWLGDADLAANPSMQAALGITGIPANGAMDFPTAQKWVAALNSYNNGAGYLGHNNWQLPVAALQDSTCADTGSQGGSFGPLCTGSALGSLYYGVLNQTFPNTVAAGFGAAVPPLSNIKLSYYWALQNDGGTGSGIGGGGQEMFSFANGQQGGTTTRDSFYYVFPMVTGAIGAAPLCPAGAASGVVAYTAGPAASKAVYDCNTGYTWSADANLAASNSFGVQGNVSITYASRTITAPSINGGAMLFQTASQWIQAMNRNQYLGSSAWQMPATSKDFETFFKDLGLSSGDARLILHGTAGQFQNLQPFYYWACQRDPTGNSQSPCTGYAPPDGSTQLQWTFDFDYGFQSTSSLVQRYFVMVYYPAPAAVTVTGLQPLPDGTVYDSTLNLVWLANANLAATMPFGLNINPNGSMDYSTALQWVAQLNAFNNGAGYLGHNNWTLPGTPSNDRSCSSFNAAGGGSFGSGCTGSAMGSLFYRSLGLSYPNTAIPVLSNTTGPFSNFQPYLYWSGTVMPDATQGYHTFSFETGWQGANVDGHYIYALPMIKGNPFGISQASGTGTLLVSKDGQTIYDPSTDVTWLANANLAKTQAFGMCVSVSSQQCINPDGAMTHTIALSWIQSMNNAHYLNQSGWQLPPADTCGGFGCASMSNPMGELFYKQLKLTQGTPAAATPAISVGPFNNLQPYLYWACSSPDTQPPCQSPAPASGFAWSFSFGNGFEGTDLVGNNLFVMVYYPAVTSAGLSVASGGTTSTNTAGVATQTDQGYATLKVNSGNVPYGTAVFSLEENGVVITEAGVPASPPTTSARIFIDYRASVPAYPSNPNLGTINIDTGIAIANPGGAAANVAYILRDRVGTTVAIGHGTVAAGAHFAKFIDQFNNVAPDFSLPSNFPSSTQFGTLEVDSDAPLSMLALRLTVNQAGETLLTSTPSADLTKVPAASPAYFPQFVDGGGFVTTILLLNTSTQIETGKLNLSDNNGLPLRVRSVDGISGSSFTYSIPPAGVYIFQTDGSSPPNVQGTAQLQPDTGTLSPAGAGVFRYIPGSIVLTESGIPAAVPTTHARIYIDKSGGHDTGLALAAPGPGALNLSLKAFQADGVTEVGQASIPLGANAHTAAFVGTWISSIPNGFTGVLDISAPAPFVALTLRSLTNIRGTLLTTFPIADVTQPAPSPVIFPQIADGAGFATQFILINTGTVSASTTLQYFGDSGVSLPVGK